MLQGNGVTMIALGVLNDTPPNTIQPKLADGIHLRAMFARDLGFPWYGFYVFRRETGGGHPLCLGASIGKLPIGPMTASTLDTPLGRVSSPYVPGTNLMSGSSRAAATLTQRQLDFVFSANEETHYSVEGWVFFRKKNEKQNAPVWFSNGVTKATPEWGISYRNDSDENSGKPCKDISSYQQYCSYKPLPGGLRLHNHEDSWTISA